MQFMSKFVCFQICLLMKDLELGLLWILLPLNLEFQDHVFHSRLIDSGGIRVQT